MQDYDEGCLPPDVYTGCLPPDVYTGCLPPDVYHRMFTTGCLHRMLLEYLTLLMETGLSSYDVRRTYMQVSWILTMSICPRWSFYRYTDLRAMFDLRSSPSLPLFLDIVLINKHCPA